MQLHRLGIVFIILFSKVILSCELLYYFSFLAMIGQAELKPDTAYKNMCPIVQTLTTKERIPRRKFEVL